MKLTDFKVIYICPDHNEKYHARKCHMDTMLARIGFRDITHFKSGTEAYPACLNNATIQILEEHMDDQPFLLLEDDVEFTGADEIVWDVSADAMYLGLSRYGGSKRINRWEGNSKFEPVAEPSQVRVLNMLSAHAILYISRRYKQAIVDALRASMHQTYYNDILMSRLQPQFRVLANRVPSFYQSNRFNSHDLEAATRFVLGPYGNPI